MQNIIHQTEGEITMIIHEIIETLNGTTKRRNRRHVTVGTTIGILVGAIAGILLAPKSGKETREDIRNVAEIGIENANKAAIKAAKFVKKEAAAVKEKVNDLKTHRKHSKEIIEEAAEDIAEEVKSRV
jgi:gas vesicle protein